LEHDNAVEKSLESLVKAVNTQGAAIQAAAGALQRLSGVSEAFVRRNSPETMGFLPTDPPNYLSLRGGWRKMAKDKGEGGSGLKGKENPAAPSGEEGSSGGKEGDGGGKEGGDKGGEGGDVD
jgi:hypothetical protein